MIVVDASAIVELITDESGLSDRVRHELTQDPQWAVPEHALVEVASALRGLWLGGRSTDTELDARLAALLTLELTTFSTASLLKGMRQLMHNTTAYDAAYVALAQQLDVPLVTLDGKLADLPGSTAEVRVVSA